MRPIRQVVTPTLSGGAYGPWIVLDYLQRPFDVALFVDLSEDASGITYSVEYTPDNPNTGKLTQNNVVSLTRVTTTATLTFLNPHNLGVGDSVTVTGSGDATLDGTFAVASTPTTTSLTYAVATGTAQGSVYTQAVPMTVFPHETLVALTADASGNFAFPCAACRLHITAWVAGSARLTVIQGYARG
jgi:protein involved in polysaccharide export with SLBB domain